MADDDLLPWLTLVHTKGLGPGTLRRLLEGLGSIDAILGASDSKLRQAGLSAKVITSMRNIDQEQMDTDLTWAGEAEDRAIITRDSKHYPKMLLQIADAPLVLYVRGDPEVLNTPQLAVVGTRKPTPGAERHAFDMARQLAGYGITITSGLALGIDSFAHRGALEAGGFTIAVTSTGLDRVYPAKHQQLARDIAEKSAIVSEFPIGTNPIASYFPRRNRIISGMCYGTLVVEATLKSGTLTTAAHATSQAREVFAIPGNIDNQQSRGCHALLKNGATLVEDVADILVQLAPLLPKSLDSDLSEPSDTPEVDKSRGNSDNENPKQTFDQDPARASLLASLSGDPISLDQLVERSGLDIVTVTKMTVDLELDGMIEKIPGGNFVKTFA